MIEYDTFEAYGFTPLKYRPLRNAAINGHLSTCKWIKEQVSVKTFIQMVEFDLHAILREIVNHNQPEVFKWFNEEVPTIIKDFLKCNECDRYFMDKYRRMLLGMNDSGYDSHSKIIPYMITPDGLCNADF